MGMESEGGEDQRAATTAEGDTTGAYSKKLAPQPAQDDWYVRTGWGPKRIDPENPLPPYDHARARPLNIHAAVKELRLATGTLVHIFRPSPSRLATLIEDIELTVAGCMVGGSDVPHRRVMTLVIEQCSNCPVSMGCQWTRIVTRLVNPNCYET